MKKFFLIITGPHVYLQNSPKIEEYSISQEEIDEIREDGESDDDVINYLRKLLLYGNRDCVK